MTGKQNILRPFRNVITLLLLLITFKQSSGHNIKWDHFDILSSGKTDYHCEAKKALFIQELQLALNVNVSSEIFYLYYCVTSQTVSF